MPFEFIPTNLEGLVKIHPTRFDDERGWFQESYQYSQFSDAGISVSFVQDNHSCSQAGTLRGLHYQLDPCAQGKLIRVVSGRVYDVAVDIRRSSPTFGRWYGMIISAENAEMLWVPRGFAHGFLALENNTQLLYKCTVEYNQNYERAVRWDDPDIGIEWPVVNNKKFLLSPKDAASPLLQDVEVFA